MEKFEGTIHLIDSADKFPEALKLLEGNNLLGVDTETKPSFKKGISYHVSLLQLATAKDVFIFRLNKIGLPDELVRILNSRRIIKAGIALHDDMKDLRRLNPALRAQGVVDLNKLAQGLGFESIGAKKLSALVLGFSISKKEQTSNWEAEVLSPSQLSYAATDAWISFLIYKKLVQHDLI
jgi:ribonuclease D